MNAFPSNSDPRDAHLHATLQRIDQLANEDVEMQAPISESTTFIIVDTNIVLHQFEVLTQFVEDIERQALPTIVVIPGAVIYELDGQKNRDGLAWFARRASAWLLRKIKERKAVKGQANEETCKASGNWKIKVPGEDFGSERVNDALILDCCKYFQQGGQTYLCSADNNLCFESHAEGTSAISPTRNWSSRDIARAIYEYGAVDLSQFGPYRVSYKDRTAPIAETGSAEDDDRMNVDDDPLQTEVVQPSHALDLLHIQVIEHFTRLLVELVGRVGVPETAGGAQGDMDGASASRYAPQWQRRHQSEWEAGDCLGYLCSKRAVGSTRPEVEVFLSRPYTRAGARRGQDWSRRDWEVALAGLGSVGARWDEQSIAESLGVLEGHVQLVFATRMRPTGV